MIARPKISRNEWKTAEIGAFEVGNFAPALAVTIQGLSTGRMDSPTSLL